MIFIIVMKTLIINAELVNPPSSVTSFRDLTLFCKIKCEMDIILECDTEYKDIYFDFLHKRGALDFIEYIISIDEREPGIRLDTKNRIETTITVDRIVPENTQFLLFKLGGHTLWSPMI